jgi:hypothetical protein
MKFSNYQFPIESPYRRSIGTPPVRRHPRRGPTPTPCQFQNLWFLKGVETMGEQEANSWLLDVEPEIIEVPIRR